MENGHTRFGVFDTGDFNFGDLSMKNDQSDYFSQKPSRGASPTSGLAADFCRNFYIDKRYRLGLLLRSNAKSE